MLLVCWIVLLDLFTPRSLPAPSAPRGAMFAFHVTLEYLGVRSLRAFFRSQRDLFGARLGFASRRLGAPFWRFPALDVLDRMARSSVYIGLIALAFGVGMGLAMGTSPEWRL